MTASAKAMWDSLSPEMKQAVAGLAAAWLSRRARRIEAGLPASSPEVSDEDSLETGSNDTAPAPASPVHAGLTMKQAQVHYNAVLAEVEPVPAPLRGCERALEQHRLAEGQLGGECASKETVAAMPAANPNFVTEQCAIYEALRAQAAARQEAAAVAAQLRAIAASCASYAARWDFDSATISIVDLTSTGDVQGADSSKDE
jgi:hypothetical protein